MKTLFPRARPTPPAGAGHNPAPPTTSRPNPPRSHHKLSPHPSISQPRPRPAPRAAISCFSERCPNRPTPTGAAPTVPPRPAGGDGRARTGDLLLAKQALSQLSYAPVPEEDRRQRTRSPCSVVRILSSVFCRPYSVVRLVGQGGFEPPTSRLSSARSNRLSY